MRGEGAIISLEQLYRVDGMFTQVGNIQYYYWPAYQRCADASACGRRSARILEIRGLTADPRQHLPPDAVADADLWSESAD